MKEFHSSVYFLHVGLSQHFLMPSQTATIVFILSSLPNGKFLSVFICQSLVSIKGEHVFILLSATHVQACLWLVDSCWVCNDVSNLDNETLWEEPSLLWKSLDLTLLRSHSHNIVKGPHCPCMVALWESSREIIWKQMVRLLIDFEWWIVWKRFFLLH